MKKQMLNRIVINSILAFCCFAVVLLLCFKTMLNPIDLRIEPHTRKLYVSRNLETWDYTVRLFALFIASLFGLIFIQEIIKK